MQLADVQILQAMDILTQQYRELCQQAGVDVTEEELREPAERLRERLKHNQQGRTGFVQVVSTQKSPVVL